jgi:D-beta-D-heptose 7-phosphate kinase/D-beta-D-heptose 1-phosphate adenosyltransferase
MKRVFVNGTFDIVHVAHIKLLNTARSMGDYLMVAIDSDRRIQELKGKKRPINNEYERLGLMLNLKSVDEVKVFDSDEELIKIIKEYQPDVMVKGSDYRYRPILGQEYCKHIEFFERIDEYSTTKKIQDIIARR